MEFYYGKSNSLMYMYHMHMEIGKSSLGTRLGSIESVHVLVFLSTEFYDKW